MLTDALTTDSFLPKLNVVIVIQEYPFEGLADEPTVCLKLFSKLPYLIGFVAFIYNYYCTVRIIPFMFTVKLF